MFNAAYISNSLLWKSICSIIGSLVCLLHGICPVYQWVILIETYQMHGYSEQHDYKIPSLEG
jgi:hypothetical protein